MAWPPQTHQDVQDATTSLLYVGAGIITAAAYTFGLADVGRVVEGNSGAAQTFTVPPASAVAWPVGAVIEVYQLGAGQISLVGGAGVTLQNPSSLIVRAQYSSIGIRYRGGDVWAVSGDLA